MNERETSYRPFWLEIGGQLSISDFHIGSGVTLAIHTDAPVHRDVSGRPYLPGSSLRGVLRAHLEREGPLLLGKDADSALRRLFGETPHKGQKGVHSHAGRLTVFDVQPLEKGFSDVRDHVRVNEKWGAAAHGAKFDREVSEARGGMPFRLIYEGDSGNDDELVLVGEAIRALEDGELACGAKSGIGLGRMRLNGVKAGHFDRTSPVELAAWLECRMNEEYQPQGEFKFPPAKQASSAREARSWLELDFTIRFEGPVLVRAAIPPQLDDKTYDPKDRSKYAEKGLVTADHVFVSRGSKREYYLPGSSLRGVLRHQAIRIENTLKVTGAVEELFGTVKGPDGGMKGLIEVSDGVLDDRPQLVYLDHVAIDRITGFAADGKKFATCGLQSPAFRTKIRLHFAEHQWYLAALVGFLVRDLQEGLLWCGGGVTRGYGFAKTIMVHSVTMDLVNDQVAGGIPAEAATEPHRNARIQISASELDFATGWFWKKADDAWGKRRASLQEGNTRP